jgi:hypothetical protein
MQPARFTLPLHVYVPRCGRTRAAFQGLLARVLPVMRDPPHAVLSVTENVVAALVAGGTPIAVRRAVETALSARVGEAEFFGLVELAAELDDYGCAPSQPRRSVRKSAARARNRWQADVGSITPTMVNTGAVAKTIVRDQDIDPSAFADDHLRTMAPGHDVSLSRLAVAPVPFARIHANLGTLSEGQAHGTVGSLHKLSTVAHVYQQRHQRQTTPRESQATQRMAKKRRYPDSVVQSNWLLPDVRRDKLSLPSKNLQLSDSVDQLGQAAASRCVRQMGRRRRYRLPSAQANVMPEPVQTSKRRYSLPVTKLDEVPCTPLSTQQHKQGHGKVEQRENVQDADDLENEQLSPMSTAVPIVVPQRDRLLDARKGRPPRQPQLPFLARVQPLTLSPEILLQRNSQQQRGLGPSATLSVRTRRQRLPSRQEPHDPAQPHSLKEGDADAHQTLGASHPNGSSHIPLKGRSPDPSLSLSLSLSSSPAPSRSPEPEVITISSDGSSTSSALVSSDPQSRSKVPISGPQEAPRDPASVHHNLSKRTRRAVAAWPDVHSLLALDSAELGALCRSSADSSVGSGLPKWAQNVPVGLDVARLRQICATMQAEARNVVDKWEP